MSEKVDGQTFKGFMRLAKTLPQTAAEAVKGKYVCWKASQELIKVRRPLGWRESAAHSIRDQLKRQLADRNRMHSGDFGKEEAASPVVGGGS